MYHNTNYKRVLRPALLVYLISGLLFAFQQSHAQCDFEEVAEAQNITHTFNAGVLGGGVSFMDFDGDGWDDLTFGTSKGELIEIYKNNQGQFEKVSLTGITNTCESKQVAWIDFDNDGDKDLFYTCAEINAVLYRNDGNLNFTDVTAEMGLTTPDALSMGANWADFDRDGWLDLYITYYGTIRNQLFKNHEGTSFSNISLETNVDPAGKPAFCAVVFDYDGDQWEDIYLANDRSTRNDLIRNVAGESFEDVSAISHSNLAMDAMGTTILDMNGDGLFEIYVSNSPDGNALLFNNGDGTFEEIAQESGTIFNSVGWGVNTLDIDNDACDDLYVSGSVVGIEVPSSALYRAIGPLHFETTQYPGMQGDTLSSFSNAVGDFNNDGKTDIAVSNSNGTYSQLWQNTCINDNHWLKLQLEGTISNRDAIGTKAVVYMDGIPNYQYKTAGISFMAQNTDYLHFGLAESTTVDSLIVYWPSGLTDKLINPGIDQVVHLSEGSMATLVPLTTSHNIESLCTGEEVTLSVGLTGRTYDVQWSDNSMGNNLIVSESGDYHATIKFATESISSETLSIGFYDLPEVTSRVTDVTNDGLGEIALTPLTSGYSYLWSHDINLNAPIASDLQPGNYVVKIASGADCYLTLTFEIKSNIVTGLDDPLVQSISYKRQADQLIIELPTELRSKLQQSQVLNTNGQRLHKANHQPSETGHLAIANIPHRQTIIVQLRFSDGRLIKKLFFED
ncbi:MAG: CRTAC1 family protein [Roseivirga sp.]|nr:CRTAC1 family protein [Roseivirga sp.]